MLRISKAPRTYRAFPKFPPFSFRVAREVFGKFDIARFEDLPAHPRNSLFGGAGYGMSPEGALPHAAKTPPAISALSPHSHGAWNLFEKCDFAHFEDPRKLETFEYSAEE